MIPEDNLPALIVGLGNPDKKFLPTRHNIGFWFIESLADNLRVTFNDNLKKGIQETSYEPFIIGGGQIYDYAIKNNCSL